MFGSVNEYARKSMLVCAAVISLMSACWQGSAGQK